MKKELGSNFWLDRNAELEDKDMIMDFLPRGF
jgi:hypothetical protein